VTFNGLHGVISQKIILFITTAVKTSNPTFQNIGSAELRVPLISGRYHVLVAV
jgi:hypothetical protein